MLLERDGPQTGGGLRLGFSFPRLIYFRTKKNTALIGEEWKKEQSLKEMLCWGLNYKSIVSYMSAVLGRQGFGSLAYSQVFLNSEEEARIRRW